MVFSAYYILYPNEADEKLRRFRAVPTVEMLRTTLEKTTNPYIRLIMSLPQVPVRRKILLPRPKNSQYTRPITTYLFFQPTGRQLNETTDLILDFPGGGFVAQSPEHHEERLRIWAIKTGRPALSVDYGKAPEYPYPYAIDEAFDTYKVLVASVGRLIGMSGKKLNVIISGDSAGATLAINIVLKVLEYNHSEELLNGSTILPQPLALVLNYAALDFNFTSWMSAAHLRVLRSEQSSGNLPGLKELAAQKDHFQHVSPLSMVKDNIFSKPRGKHMKRRSSWKDVIRDFASGSDRESDRPSGSHVRRFLSAPHSPNSRIMGSQETPHGDVGVHTDTEMEDQDEDDDLGHRKEEDWPISARVRYTYPPAASSPMSRSDSMLDHGQQLSAALEGVSSGTPETNESKGLTEGKEPIGTRLTMTSRTGYFQDRIISPSMMRAMAILYIGPYRNPDFATDYQLSPILTPAHLLAQFPQLLLQCGEKDPFVDDTVIFAGRVREAKRARKAELELAISGKSARFGEGLRMSGTPESFDDKSFAEIQRERDKLARETEEDWVQMVLFSDWSHGYLQMPGVLAEAKAVVEGLAEWIDEAFSRNAKQGVLQGDQIRTNGHGHRPSPSHETELDDAGIIFVPKKYQNVLAVDNQVSSVVAREEELDAENATISGSEEHAFVDKTVSGMRSTPQGYETPKGSSSRQGGTPITETELMRRRRLLDSHIFE